MADFEPIPYRIRIGVTGYRKLDDPAATVKKAIDAEVENRRQHNRAKALRV